MISVVIPVYNVSEYINQCMESVVNQTYGDLEIILINDGSTDNSGELCREWAKKDSRIIYIDKENEGQGTTRNRGIEMATGEIITFVDPDDYLEPDAYECAHKKMTEENADIIEYNYYKLEYVKECLVKTLVWAVNEVRENQISNMHTVLWNKLYRRKLFMEYNIRMTNYVCEDFIVLPLLYMYANKVVCVDKPLYNYNCYRPGNLSTSYNRITEAVKSIDELNRECRVRGFFPEYEEAVSILSYSIAKMFIARADRLETYRANEVKKAYISCMERNYKQFLTQQNIRKSCVTIFGSYNVRLIAHKMLWEGRQIRGHYGYSSIVSAVSPKGKHIGFKGNNEYRQSMIDRECSREFANLTESGSDYLFMDLLEEISPIIIDGKVSYTLSEIVENRDEFSDREILYITDNGRKVWFYQYIDKFMDKVLSLWDAKHIIIFRNKLCETYGITQGHRPYKEDVKKINEVLEEYYSYVENKYSDIRVISIDDESLKYTDSRFLYGIKPYYYNDRYYKAMADTLLKEGGIQYENE